MDPKPYCVFSSASVRETMERIDRSHGGIALVTEENGRLIAVITDGDIRRALLRNIDVSMPITEVIRNLEPAAHPQPFIMPAGTDPGRLLELMRLHHLHQIPLVDKQGCVVELSLLQELIDESDFGITTVLMAGGFGKRLRPMTNNTPKPMLHVGDEPLLRRAIERLRKSGVRHINVTVHYMKDVITEYFGDGSNFGVDIEYFQEDTPLGTAGAVANIPHGNRTVLVMNGDVLTNLDFRAMFDFHRRHKALMSVAVAPYDVTVPYGVVELNDMCISKLVEKPKHRYFVNTGIYMLEPAACEKIPRNRRYDMTDLIQKLLAEGAPVIGFPIHEYWRDIGHPEDYEHANEDVQQLNASVQK